MVEFVKDEIGKADADGKKEIEKIVMALSAEAQLRKQVEEDRKDASRIAEGRKLIAQSENFECTQCHKWHGAGKTKAPDLTGYGSRQWMIEFVSNPSHKRFYGEKNDRMPLFGEKQLLTEQQIGMVVDWLRGEWYEPGVARAETSVAPAATQGAISQPTTKPAQN
jgi:ubiquinol-cytochrome c reductase cytochrome b subunit